MPHLLAGTADGTALVRHGPSLNGTVDGSIQQMLPESVTLNGGAIVTGDLLVPGRPTVRLNGKPTFLGALDLDGAVTPSNHQITLNGGASLGHVVRRVDPIPLTTVAAPALPAGTRSVTVNVPGQAVGPWLTLRNLTLNGGVGDVAVPPGTYGDFTANGGTSFTLGVAGATQATAYTFQRINLNGQAQIRVVGPAVLTVAYGLSANGGIGVGAHPEWLTLNVYSGGFTLNGGSQVHGFVNAPAGTVTINGNSQLVGGVSCDRLTVNGGGLLRLVSPISDNLPPVAQPDSLTLDEDASVLATLAGSDPEGAPVTFVIASRPDHGSLHTSSGPITVYPTAPLTESAIRYVPLPDFAGSDSFTFSVNDGQLESPPATISLLVRPINDAPVASADPVTLPEDAPEGAALTLRAVDIDSPVTTFTIVAGPAFGQLLPGSSDAVRIYRPDPNYFGSDSVTFLAHDGLLNSELVTVAITVTPVNDPPVAFAQSLVTREETGLDFVLTGFDVDGDALAFIRVGDPFGGLLSGTGASLDYQPLLDFAGLDWFEYKVSDGQSESAPATILIEVTNENDAPGADSFAVTTNEDVTATITLAGADPDGDPIWFSIVRQPEHAQGELVVNGSTVTYRPIGDYFGPDTFTYKATDIFGADSPEATVTIMVESINDAPVAHGQAVSTEEDRPVEVTLTGTDTEDPSVSFEIVQHPAMGGLTGGVDPGVYQYVPHSNQNGTDQFIFVVRDSEGLASESVVVPIAIQPVNDAPVALSRTLEVAEDGELPFEFTSTDVEGDPVSYEIAAPPQFGTITPEAATSAARVYTPAANYHGPDSLTFIARDADASEPVTVSIIVLPVNDAPEASAPEVITDRNVAVPFTLVAHDVDGDALVYDLIAGLSHGTLDTPSGPLGTFPHSDLLTPNLTYQPDPDFAGEDVLTFQARDPAGAASAIVTVPIIVRATNRAPVAQSASFETLEDEPLGLVLGASDPDGDALTYLLVTLPAHGTLSGTAPNLVFMPHADFNGRDSVTFKVSDGQSESVEATVGVTVHPVIDTPDATLGVTTPGGVVSTNDTLTLTATATSVDGPITRVEFFDGDILLGEVASGPFELSWRPSTPGVHIFWVRVHAAGGGMTDSLKRAIVVLAALPYVTDFEFSEGYLPGNIDGQLGWSAVGSAAIVAGDSASGAQALALIGGLAIPEATQLVAPKGQDETVFIDFFARPVAGPVPEGSVSFDGQAAILASVIQGPDLAELYVWRCDGSAGGEWFASGFTFSIDAARAATTWLRITVRKDYAGKEWDLFLNGGMVQGALPFLDSGVDRLGRLMFVGPIAGAARVDDIYAGADNPLFADGDRDGIDDGYEVINGMSPSADDRAGDIDSDGLNNLREFLLATRANASDSDGDGMPDSWEVANGLDPTSAAGATDSDGDALSDVHEFGRGTDPTDSDSDDDGMPDGWEVIHGLNPTLNDSESDEDSDGIPALEEWMLETDPNQPNTRPQRRVLPIGHDDQTICSDGQLAVLVTDEDYNPLPGLRVLFRARGDHLLSDLPDGMAAKEVTVLSDSLGIARAYVVTGGRP